MTVAMAKPHARDAQSLMTGLTAMKFALDNEMVAAAILLSLPEPIQTEKFSHAEIMMDWLEETAG